MTRSAVALALLALGCGCGSAGGRAEPATRETRETVTTVAPGPGAERPPRPHPPRETALRLVRRLTKTESREDERLAEAASALIGVDASVRCWSGKGWRRITAASNAELPPDERGEFDGYTDIFDLRIDLAPWVCEELTGLPENAGAGDELALAAALAVFTHETRHLTAAGSNEAAAECAALQRMDDAGRLLGLSDATARRLARLTWTELYPTLHEDYRSTECRPGGSLDREPETREFP